MLTTQEREYLLNSMKSLLDEYSYSYDVFALNKIIDEWASQKAELIEAFKRHPNYICGKFMIAFTQNYEREFNVKTIKDFSYYLECIARLRVSGLPDDINQQRIEQDCPILPFRLYTFLTHLDTHINSRTISEETAKLLEEIIPQIHPHAGQKASRVINKICQYLNYDKDPNYNREFAKFADGLSPIVIRRHTILSINPLDYLTMSFGNSWTSCHTIDKWNKRGISDGYSGCYSSGTVSYMLDRTSMVFYTVDAKYDGDDYWTQPKICRQMFHYGEEKLVQSRLYPQSNDGDDEVYTPYRNIVQSIISLIFDFPNLWKLSRGSDPASRYIDSEGTHYRDYECFGTCSLSRIQDSTNENNITVGAEPICIDCGQYHDTEDNINCCNAGRVCERCGRRIRCEDDEYWVGDYCYCEDCVSYCHCCDQYEINENMIWVESEGRYICEYCVDNYYYRCEHCGEYIHQDDINYIESQDVNVCDDCLSEHYTRCDGCDEYYPNDEITETDGYYYCTDCYETTLEEEEE